MSEIIPGDRCRGHPRLSRLVNPVAGSAAQPRAAGLLWKATPGVQVTLAGSPPRPRRRDLHRSRTRAAIAVVFRDPPMQLAQAHRRGLVSVVVDPPGRQRQLRDRGQRHVVDRAGRMCAAAPPAGRTGGEPRDWRAVPRFAPRRPRCGLTAFPGTRARCWRVTTLRRDRDAPTTPASTPSARDWCRPDLHPGLSPTAEPAAVQAAMLMVAGDGTLLPIARRVTRTLLPTASPNSRSICMSLFIAYL